MFLPMSDILGDKRTYSPTLKFHTYLLDVKRSENTNSKKKRKEKKRKGKSK